MEELVMLRQKVQLVEQQANENQASSQVLQQMIKSGAAKVEDGNSIIIQPSQQEVKFGVQNNQMEDDPQISNQQLLNEVVGSLD